MRSHARSAAVLSLLLVGCSPSPGGLSPTVTKAGIRAIRLGDSEARVRQLLGAPLQRDVISEADLSLSFARRVSGAYAYPMLWVGLHDGGVTEVYAKEYVYWGHDDGCVYLLNRDHPTGWAPPDFERTFLR